MQIILNIKETVVDEFMQLLKRFPDKDIVIENQAFIEEKSRLQKDLNSINNSAAMVQVRLNRQLSYIAYDDPSRWCNLKKEILKFWI